MYIQYVYLLLFNILIINHLQLTNYCNVYATYEYAKIDQIILFIIIYYEIIIFIL